MCYTSHLYFGPLEGKRWRGCLLLTKKSRREFFQKIFALGILWGGVSRYSATPLNVSLYPGDSDSTRFRLWSPIAAGNCLDRAEKIQTLLRRLANLTFLIRVQSFRDPLHGELSHVQIFMNDGPKPLTWYACCSAIHLPEIRRYFKISSWSWSIISGVLLFWVVQNKGHHRWKNHQV